MEKVASLVSVFQKVSLFEVLFLVGLISFQFGIAFFVSPDLLLKTPIWISIILVLGWAFALYLICCIAGYFFWPFFCNVIGVFSLANCFWVIVQLEALALVSFTNLSLKGFVSVHTALAVGSALLLFALFWRNPQQLLKFLQAMYKIMIGGYLQTSGNAANSDKLADVDIFRNSGNSNDPLQDLKLDFSNSAETSKKENVQG